LLARFVTDFADDLKKFPGEAHKQWNQVFSSHPRAMILAVKYNF